MLRISTRGEFQRAGETLRMSFQHAELRSALSQQNQEESELLCHRRAPGEGWRGGSWAVGSGGGGGLLYYRPVSK